MLVRSTPIILTNPFINLINLINHINSISQSYGTLHCSTVSQPGR
jgi:hypothetical protein